MTIHLKGVAASPGIVIGQARHVVRTKTEVVYQEIIGPGQIVSETHRLRSAFVEVEEELKKIKATIEKELPAHIYLIEAHLMMLKDPLLGKRAEKLIEEQMINAEWSLVEAVREIAHKFDKIDDPYIKSRIEDVEAVADRVLRFLAGQNGQDISAINEPGIFIAHDFSPSDTTQIRLDRVMGFVTEMGSRTSHTSIVAQSVQLPAVVGLENALEQIPGGSVIIVDGSAGEVIVHPDDETLLEYEDRKERYESFIVDIKKKASQPAITNDGCEIKVQANIELPEETETALDAGAEGIGLVRTEFLYLNRTDLPSEDELFESLSKITSRSKGKPVVIRTLDLGGDKFAHQLDIEQEMNPAMGLRAVRLCLIRPDIFKPQLRAILRASVHGPIKIMFPMISGVMEFIQCREIFNECQKELIARKVDFDPDIKIGCMIEVPSAVTVVDVLAKYADFFSIGTNDLIQYSLAIDRVNKNVAHMYKPFHPAVLRMIRSVINAGINADIPVAMCGEMAGEPVAVPLLIGMGLKEFSVNPVGLPRVKQMIRLVNAKLCRQMADKVMEFDIESDVADYLNNQLPIVSNGALGGDSPLKF